jgi:hypothetical protein
MKQYIGGIKREQKDEVNTYKFSLTRELIDDSMITIGDYNIDSIIMHPTMTISGTFTTSYVDPSFFTTFQKPNPKYIGGYKHIQK